MIRDITRIRAYLFAADYQFGTLLHYEMLLHQAIYQGTEPLITRSWN